MSVNCFVQDNVGVMLLQRPKALHALTLPMIDTMTTHLLEWQHAPNVHAVVIHAEPAKPFVLVVTFDKFMIYGERFHNSSIFLSASIV